MCRGRAIEIAIETVTMCSWVPVNWVCMNIFMDGTSVGFPGDVSAKGGDGWPRKDPFCFKYGVGLEHDYWVIHREWLREKGYIK